MKLFGIGALLSSQFDQLVGTMTEIRNLVHTSGATQEKPTILDKMSWDTFNNEHKNRFN